MQFKQLQKTTVGLLQAIHCFWKPASSEELLSEEEYLRMMDILAEHTHCDAGTLKSSYHFFVGRAKTREILSKLCWHLAANKQSFRHGKTVPYSYPILRPEVMELRICDVQAIEDKVRLKVHILSGPLASQIKRLTISSEIADVLLYKLGYSFTGKYQPFATIDSLPGLYAKCLLKLPKDLLSMEDPSTTDFDICHLQWLEAKDAIAWNRKYILQYRLGLEPCPCNQLDRDSQYSYCTTQCKHTWQSCPAATYDGCIPLEDLTEGEVA